LTERRKRTRKEEVLMSESNWCGSLLHIDIADKASVPQSNCVTTETARNIRQQVIRIRRRTRPGLNSCEILCRAAEVLVGYRFSRLVSFQVVETKTAMSKKSTDNAARHP
jgi:hypothetical protein